MKPISKLLYDGYQHQLRKQFAEAERIYRKILRSDVGNVDVIILLAMVCKAQSRSQEALELFEKAIRLDPLSALAHYHRGVELVSLERIEEAASSFRRAYEIKPTLPHALSSYGYWSRMLCDWSNYDALQRNFETSASDPNALLVPLTFLMFVDDPALQYTAIRNWVKSQNLIPGTPGTARRSAKNAGDRIRLAYVSADFRHHAVSHIIIELFERHDRSLFEVTGISIGHNDASEMRRRIEGAFDRFVDAEKWSTDTLAGYIRELGVDVLVDLMGHTTNHRVDVFAHRPAPIQVGFLGFPGTMGDDFMDYVIADKFVVPPDEQPFFAEKLVYLPDCYQPNDTKRTINTCVPSRLECGLPAEGFVFCSLNNSVKLTPRIFDIWMRLLLAVPGSVLWLVQDYAAGVQNLQCEAAARGVDPNRIVFAARVPLADHLARQSLADLFLDTLPWNGHATASHALWAGVPIVTCAGKSFAGRVAGSLLNTVGLPELVTETLDDYEALALALARDPARLADIRGRLAKNRHSTPLFDSERYSRHIESAYQAMVEIWRRGEPPRPIVVEPITSRAGPGMRSSPDPSRFK